MAHTKKSITLPDGRNKRPSVGEDFLINLGIQIKSLITFAD